MKLLHRTLLTICTFCLVATVHASPGKHRGTGNIETCLESVHKIKKGAFLRVEYRSFSQEGAVYEIELLDYKKRKWEFECNQRGEVVEIEQEVTSASDPLFKKHVKVSEREAKTTALSIYPGEIEKVEYEIEFDGSPSYEFNIETPDGTDFNVEISGVTGQIIEVSTELWEIGAEE